MRYTTSLPSAVQHDTQMLTLTFNPLQAMTMTHTHAKEAEGQLVQKIE